MSCSSDDGRSICTIIFRKWTHSVDDGLLWGSLKREAPTLADKSRDSRRVHDEENRKCTV